MQSVVISGSGRFVPAPYIGNQELCEVFNEYVRGENARNQSAIARGEREALQESSPQFILKASGIQRRHVYTRDGIIDPTRMCPNIPDRADDELSVQAEMAIAAAREALADARRVPADVDMIIVAALHIQRAYPQLAMEVQHALGAEGFAFDMTVGCSSATFALPVAVDTIRAGGARCVLLINPELMTPQVNWRDRDSHFIFGDAASALVIEPAHSCATDARWEIVDSRRWSRFSSNIRNNAGFVNRCDPTGIDAPDKLFYQRGRRVYKEMIALVPSLVQSHLEANDLVTDEISRLWLHQANINLDRSIATRLLGREPSEAELPVTLDRYANTASAGAVLTFHETCRDLPSGATGVLCSFGAGYSVGSVILRRTHGK